MPQIEIDDDVYAALQRLATPFVDTPNSTIRKVLGLIPPAPPTTSRLDVASHAVPEDKHERADTADLDALLEEAMRAAPRVKARRADLRELIRVGMIRDGEQLSLIDYRGARVPNAEAIVADGSLIHAGRRYSMSDLARELLKKVGYASDAVRGPAHWATAQHGTIMQLWQRHLDRTLKRADATK